ncbi:MAG: Ig-like domain-containing protein [Candidatus Neomarinimicrobiota bacterium]
MKRVVLLSFWLFSFHYLCAQVTGLSGWNIYLDPGHSMKENMGIYGYSEAEKNLRVASALRNLLTTMTDIDTVFRSRTNDQQQVSLSQRTDHANNAFGQAQPAAWFHSIHSDAGSPQSNSTLLLWGQYDNGNEKEPKGGQAMSDIMVDLLTRGMRTTTRGSIGDCSFYTWSDWCQQSGGPYLHVNRNSVMPSELSEAGFHTSPRQNQRNMNAQWKELEALTFFWSILKYHETDRPFVGTCAGIISDLETGVPVNGAVVTLNGQTDTTDSFESLFHKYANDPGLLHNGFYFLENLPDDTLELTVKADGFYGDTVQVVVVDTFFTFADPKLISKVPPHVVSTEPAEGDTNVPAWDPIVIEFSREMKHASVETTLAIVPHSEGTFLWSDDGEKMRFQPDTLEFEEHYAVTVSGKSLDVYGHPLDGNGDGTGGDDFTLSFRTGPPDMYPPDILTVHPSLNASNVELNLIVSVTYDEELDESSISDDIFKLERFSDRSAVSGILEHYVVGSQSVLSFFPAEPLHPDEIYITRVYPGLRDLAGNESFSYEAYSFRTSENTFSSRSIDDFESGTTSNWWVPQQSGSTTGIITDSTGRSVSGDMVNLLTGSTLSLKIDYGWDIHSTSWLIRTYLSGGSPRNVNFDSSYLLQIYVFGDGSGNQFRFSVDDHVPNSAAANHEVSPWYTIDWIGWRLVSWDMTNDGTGTWIGDGNLDGTLRIDSIQLTYSPGSSLFGELYFDDLQLAQVSTIDIAKEPVLLPDRYVLYQNYPNPFNPGTEITYELPRTAHVQLAVYDILGRRVKILMNGIEEPGFKKIMWDGTDDGGKPVSSGTYFIRMFARSFTGKTTNDHTRQFVQTRRAVLLR